MLKVIFRYTYCMKDGRKRVAIDAYIHNNQKRPNNPPVGLVSEATDKSNVPSTKYEHDPHIDPQLSWAGKKEGISFDVPDVSLHVHERIDPMRVVSSFMRKDDGPRQISLFDDPFNEPPLHQAMDFYHHTQDWANRLVAGDSLLVMNSLLQKEGMANKVQMIYIDPPYGIKYNSNFQPFVHKKDVKDNNDADIPAEPEMIQAFRDIWELGIHSYLTHLYDRLKLVKELLTESGSCFVQISDENIHIVRSVMDEIFGRENFVSQISFNKNSGFGASLLPTANDYILWYAKDKDKLKYHQLFKEKYGGDNSIGRYNSVMLADGTKRPATKEEKEGKLPPGARLFTYSDLTKPGPGTRYEVEFEGKKYTPGTRWWGITPEGFQKLGELLQLAKAYPTYAFWMILQHSL